MTVAPGVLADDERAMLRLAAEFWANAAAKERAISDRFGVTPVGFYQRVARLIELPAALVAEPVVVHRLQRIRDRRRARLGRAGGAA